MIAAKISQALTTAASQAFPAIALPEFALVHPEDEAHGDYASNIALILAPKVGRPAMAVAREIVQNLSPLAFIDRAAAVAPGYLNFYLTEEFLWQVAQDMSRGNFSQPKEARGEKIIFEFGQPNTHKVPHVGHLFSYIYGESCARLWEWQGAKVIRVNYQGDIGLHVAKCLWAYQREPGSDPQTGLERINYLQRCYEEGSQAYETDEAARSAIETLNRKLYAQDEAVLTDWQKTRAWSLESYRRFEAQLGIDFDKEYYESAVGNKGMEIVRHHLGEIFAQDQGAIIFRGEEVGLHTRVFVTSDGLPTYEAKELGLLEAKKADFSPFSRLVITTAREQNDYWQVLIKVAERLDSSMAGKIIHIGFGMITLTSGKLSSRWGEIISAFDLVETVREKVRLRATLDEGEGERAETTIETLALGAIRYSLLKSAAVKDITFDPESSIAAEGDSGPYLQYAYARCASVLAKAKEGGADGGARPAPFNEEEKAIFRSLERFSEATETAAQAFSPHIIASYLFELARRYSFFYDTHQILSPNPQEMALRLTLTRAVAETIKAGLNLLGIRVVARI